MNLIKTNIIYYYRKNLSLKNIEQILSIRAVINCKNVTIRITHKFFLNSYHLLLLKIFLVKNCGTDIKYQLIDDFT